MTALKELLLIALGKKDRFDHILTDAEWDGLYAEADKQSLLGVCLAGVERLPKEQYPYQDLVMEWYGQVEFVKQQNRLVSKRAAEVTKLFAEGGYRSVVLKGQGVSLLYPQPELRESGDIDLWVEGRRSDVLGFLADKGVARGELFIHHIDAKFFDDIPVEVHVWPSFTFNPIRWRRYKRWFREQAAVQFQMSDMKVGYAHPSVGFNVVYSMLHIFRHVFHEGIGLRQLLDYYYILCHTTADDRWQAVETLRWLGLEKFAKAIMYVEKEVFDISDEYLLCSPDQEYGSFLLQDIIAGGNFGRFDQRNRMNADGALGHFRLTVGRIFSMLRYFPSEVLWAPGWKIWHFIWRKVKGYRLFF